ncbi:MAG: hypothetical protein ACYC4U_03555 [Pirellulaceae bacterium]
MNRLPICSILNYFQVVLEQWNPQQTVVVRRLLLGGNTEPFVIGIEVRAHGFYEWVRVLGFVVPKRISLQPHPEMKYWLFFLRV